MYSVFPKCLVGRSPQITYHGYVIPCCWIPYSETLPYTDGKIKKNPFVRDDFNVYNNKLKDILNSPEWNKMVFNILRDTPKQCTEKCSKFATTKDGRLTTMNIGVPKINPNTETLKEHFDSYSSDSSIFWQEVDKINGNHDRIQLETTTRCTLGCLYCSRTIQAGRYPKSDLDPDVLRDVIHTKSWRKVVDCGRFGDPVFYKYWFDLLDILYTSDVRLYELHTAATGRGIKWWEKTIERLVEIKNTGTDIINVFGIDGLEDTNHIHRVNQDWNEITQVMRMSADAGIQTKWQFIPNSANENQIDRVKELAEKWNVELTFTISNRFNGARDPLLPKNPNLHATKKI